MSELPAAAPFEPMEARSADALPDGSQGEWQYEPKWDGFRCLAVKSRGVVQLWSKSGKSLDRFFPEMAAAIRDLLPDAIVLDGELVVERNGRLDFDALLARLHPAASRIRKLASETPSRFVVFDLLVAPGGQATADRPLRERRRLLEEFAAATEHRSFSLSPCTADRKQAEGWLRDGSGGDTDGVVAKRREEPYAPGERRMVKVKRVRTADCVVGGFRYASGAPVVGSLLLGLYDDRGRLDHVGFTSAIAHDERPALTGRLEALRGGRGFDGDAPGRPSRWSTERTARWEKLRPELVVEVRYDHVTAGRFRHGTTLVRFRPDKAPEQCTREQIAPATRG